MEEYRIEQRIKNNLLYRAIFDSGYESVAEFARKNDLSPTAIGTLINLRLSPLNSRGKWRELVDKIAFALAIPREKLFSESQMNAQLKTNKVVHEINEVDLKGFMLEDHEAQNPVAVIEHKELGRDLHELIRTLPERYQTVMNMRYGFCGQRAHTLEEISEELGVGKERIRQMECKALRIFKQPKHADKLKVHCYE